MTEDQLRQKFYKAQAKKQILEKNILTWEKQVFAATKEHETLLKARWILTEVSQQTQQQFKQQMEALVTMAIESVFDDRDFKFKLIFEQKRNKVECRPVIMEGEDEYEPKDDMGGGIVDVLSFALRVVLWSMEQPRSRNILFLDEPFRYVGKELIEQAGQVLQNISHKLGIQIILITHEAELARIADTAYRITHTKGFSVAERL